MRSKKKTIKIISELIGFCYDSGIKDINVDIKREKKEVTITIIGKTKKDIGEKVDGLRRMLNTPLEPQMEEYYFELVGETGHAEELSLVGMIIDKAEVYYTKDRLEIRVYKKES